MLWNLQFHSCNKLNNKLLLPCLHIGGKPMQILDSPISRLCTIHSVLEYYWQKPIYCNWCYQYSVAEFHFRPSLTVLFVASIYLSSLGKVGILLPTWQKSYQPFQIRIRHMVGNGLNVWRQFCSWCHQSQPLPESVVLRDIFFSGVLSFYIVYVDSLSISCN